MTASDDGPRGDSRSDRERDFHDAAFTSDVRSSTWKYYRAVRHLFDSYEAVTRSGGGDRDVLEYGCGRGGRSFELASCGDRVSAIDISPQAISITENVAAGAGVAISAHLMDAHRLEFADHTFDLVCGSGILHHLDLERAVPEVVRVLRPGGRAVFIEPLGHNPAINAFRRRTPDMRTEDEEPLRLRHLRRIERSFATASLTYGGLLTLPLAISPALAAGRLMALAESAERRLLRRSVPGLVAWFALIDCSTAT